MRRNTTHGSIAKQCDQQSTGRTTRGDELAREGDVIVVHALDRLGRTIRDTLNLIHDLAERGTGDILAALRISGESTSGALD